MEKEIENWETEKEGEEVSPNICEKDFCFDFAQGLTHPNSGLSFVLV